MQLISRLPSMAAHCRFRRFPLLQVGSNSFNPFQPRQLRRYSPNDPSINSGVVAPRRKRIVVSITGATGVALGVRILQILKAHDVETHLIVSKWGIATMKYETDITYDDLCAQATYVYSAKNVAAPISSGSFFHDGMIVIPCSMKTLAAIRCGYTEDLIVRAADVTLKEKRRLLIVPRETPLSEIHLENMLFLARMGVIIFPPVPAFYTKPATVEDIIEQSCGRILDFLGIHINTIARWNGF